MPDDDVIGKIQRQIEDAQRWPLMTTQVDTASLPTGGRGGGTVVSQTIEAALRDVLRWRPRSGDPKGFVAALNRAFEPFDVDGHTEWRWTPRTFAAQADMGALTGAQASLYHRTRLAIDEALPLLDGLNALQDADDEDLTATKSIIRYELTEIGKELAEVGGRVDDLFKMLLGSGASKDFTNVELIGGQIGQLRDRSGLNKDAVNTIDEEENLTNFMVFVGYVGGLRQAWEAEKNFFNRQGTDVFLGTQLMLLSRDLENLAGSVEECEFAMDSVFLTESERQNIELEQRSGDDYALAGITVAELLDWIKDFATHEGPQLIQDGGKDGVIAIRSTLRTLSSLVDDLMKRQESNPVPKGFVTPRVQARVDELSLRLQTALAHAEKVKRFQPSVDSLKKSEIDGSTEVWVFGSKFLNPPSVALDQIPSKGSALEAVSLPAEEVQFVSPTALRTTFSKDKVAKLYGEVRLSVRNPDGGIADIKFNDGHDGGAGPGTAGPGTDPGAGADLAVAKVKPRRARQGTTVTLSVRGMGFTENTKAELRGRTGRKIAASDIGLFKDDGTGLTATFDLSKVTPGDFKLVLVEGGQVLEAQSVFKVDPVENGTQPPPPPNTHARPAGSDSAGTSPHLTIDDFKPASADQGPNVTLTVTGTGFTDNTKAELWRNKLRIRASDDITLINGDGTALKATFDLSAVSPGSCKLVLVEGGQEVEARTEFHIGPVTDGSPAPPAPGDVKSEESDGPGDRFGGLDT
jgi:hypothetical protein